MSVVKQGIALLQGARHHLASYACTGCETSTDGQRIPAVARARCKGVYPT